jgi:hypothetical protein
MTQAPEETVLRGLVVCPGQKLPESQDDEDDDPESYDDEDDEDDPQDEEEPLVEPVSYTAGLKGEAGS